MYIFLIFSLEMEISIRGYRSFKFKGNYFPQGQNHRPVKLRLQGLFAKGDRRLPERQRVPGSSEVRQPGDRGPKGFHPEPSRKGQFDLLCQGNLKKLCQKHNKDLNTQIK